MFAHLCPGALCQPIDQTGESILGQQAYRYRTTAVQICAAEVIFSSIRQHNPYLTCQDAASLGMAGDMDRSRWPLVRSLLASTSQAVWRFNSKYCLNKLGLAQTVCGNAQGIFPVLCPNAPNCMGYEVPCVCPGGSDQVRGAGWCCPVCRWTLSLAVSTTKCWNRVSGPDLLRLTSPRCWWISDHLKMPQSKCSTLDYIKYLHVGPPPMSLSQHSMLDHLKCLNCSKLDHLKYFCLSTPHWTTSNV